MLKEEASMTYTGTLSAMEHLPVTFTANEYSGEVMAISWIFARTE
ncbi:hypothetical protein [Paenibacillus sp. N3.4]|nr:hypothetical protein [Paenibacillus sp. N3.4]